MFDVYRVAADGGTPMAVAADRYTTEYFAAPSPGGDVVAITARANAGSQWWRKGHSHLDESEIWLVRDGAAQPGGSASPVYSPITSGGAKDAWPMWAAGGKGALLHVRPERRAEHLVAVEHRRAGQRPAERAKGGNDVPRRPRAVADDFAGRQDDRVRARLRHLDGRYGDEPGARGADRAARRARGRRCRASDASPISCRSWRSRRTGRRWRSRSTARSSRRRRRTAATPRASPPRRARKPSSRGRPTAGGSRICPIATGTHQIFVYDFAAGRETQLTSGSARNDQPRFSPDGKWIAFQRDSRELRVIDPATKEEKLVATGVFDTPPFVDARDFVWSPDSRFIAYLTAGAKVFTNVHVAPVAGGGARKPVSFLANTNASALAWSPDGTYLTFNTVAAHRARRRHPRRSAAADAEVPRGSVPRPVQGRAAADPAAGARPALPRQRRRPRPPAATGRACPVSRRSRVRRHPPPRERAAGRRRRLPPADQPGRQVAAADGERRRAAEPLRLPDRRAVEGAGGRAADHLDAGAEAQRLLHARQQGGLLPRSRPRLQRHARAARAEGRRGDRGARRRLRAARSSRRSSRRGPTCAISSSTRR